MQTEQHTTEWKLGGKRNQEGNVKLNRIDLNKNEIQYNQWCNEAIQRGNFVELNFYNKQQDQSHINDNIACEGLGETRGADRESWHKLGLKFMKKK